MCDDFHSRAIVRNFKVPTNLIRELFPSRDRKLSVMRPIQLLFPAIMTRSSNVFKAGRRYKVAPCTHLNPQSCRTRERSALLRAKVEKRFERFCSVRQSRGQKMQKGKPNKEKRAIIDQCDLSTVISLSPVSISVRIQHTHIHTQTHASTIQSCSPSRFIRRIFIRDILTESFSRGYNQQIAD